MGVLFSRSEGRSLRKEEHAAEDGFVMSMEVSDMG